MDSSTRDSDDFDELIGLSLADMEGVDMGGEETEGAASNRGGFKGNIDLNRLELALATGEKAFVDEIYEATCKESDTKWSIDETLTLEACWFFANGKYDAVLRLPLGQSTFLPGVSRVERASLGAVNIYTLLPARVVDFVLKAGSGSSSNGIITEEIKYSRRLRLLYVLMVGAACLHLFMQQNYSGPSIEESSLYGFHPFPFYEDISEEYRKAAAEEKSKVLHSSSLVALQVDGDVTHTKCSLPFLLLVARILLHTVGNPSGELYTHAKLSIDSASAEAKQNLSKATRAAIDAAASAVEGKRTEYKKTALAQSQQAQSLAFRLATESLLTGPWWTMRAAVCHERLLLAKDRSETLWAEVTSCFTRIKNTMEKVYGQVRGVYPYLETHIWLEWGLVENFFNDKTKGKDSFVKAKEASGIQTELVGAMGKRTKYQVKEVAQMVLKAKSRISPEEERKEPNTESAGGETSSSVLSDKASGSGIDSVSFKVPAPKAGENSEPETEKASSEEEVEATLRTVDLDDANPDNILLERIAFQDMDFNSQCNLQMIDQAILLALCLDVKNHNPVHGLTNEEMTPYVTRVLDHANNWMIYSTGLLEKSWLEYERSHSRERAVLQLQALVDQHTTKMTITQNSSKAIEESAPAHERLRFIHVLAFPPRWELRVGLAERYAALGVLRSALEIFEDLEMWDEIIECYTLMEKKSKAEEIARQRLEIAPSPYLFCALGELTDDPTYFEKAWEISEKRYARAKRCLGAYWVAKGDLEQAIDHFETALEINPNFPQTWFTLGVVGMRTEKWALAVRAFTRVVQLEPEAHEAWGNLGSIHLRLRHFELAFAAFQEGLKHRRENWRMWENYLMCAMESSRYSEAMYAMHTLLDLRDKHKRPVDIEYLAILVEEIAFRGKKTGGNNTESQEEKGESAEDFGEGETEQGDTNHAYEMQMKKLAELLGRVTSTTNDWKVWQVYARYNDGAGRPEKAHDCRVKQLRALQSAGWEREEKKIEHILRAALAVADGHIAAKSYYQAKMQLRAILKKVETDYSDLDGYKALSEKLEEIEGYLASQ